MGAILHRMHRLNARLIKLRMGDGAAVLPASVTRIHLEFAKRWNDGHMGPRKFWREHLPRLKFWNPAVPMIVNRTDVQAGPATLTIYVRNEDDATTAAFAVTPDLQPTSSLVGASPAPPPAAPGERAVRLDLKGLHSDIILRTFLDTSGAVPIEPSPQDATLLRAVTERAEASAAASSRAAGERTERDRRKAFLAQSRQEAAAIRGE